MTWRWPWVSRRAFDVVVAERERERDEFVRGVNLDHARWMESLRTWKAAYDDLMARYHMLKLQGATIVEPAPVRERPKSDPVKAALAVASRGNPTLLREQTRAVERDRAAGLSDDDIARRILAGNRVAAEFADHEVPTTPTPSADDAPTP